MHDATALRATLVAACFLCALSACEKGADHQASTPTPVENAASQAVPADQQATRQAAANPGADPELEEAYRIAEQMRRDAEAQPATGALGLPAPDPGNPHGPNPSEHLDLQPIIGREILTYQPAVQADLSSGKLSSLLEKHRSACRKDDRLALFSLFVQSVRYGFSKMPKPQLERYYQDACEDSWLADVEEAANNGRLLIVDNGSTKDGKNVSELCVVESGRNCASSFDVGIENGALKWAEW